MSIGDATVEMLGRSDNLPAADYHAYEAMSSGGIRKILRSPLHFRLMRDHPAAPTEAMQFGTVVHAGVLEPDTLEAVCCIAPHVDRRTKAGKEEWQSFLDESAGKIALSADDMERARACIANVRKHPAAMRLLDGGDREVSLFWRDGKYDVPCKARLDAWNRGILVDVKTTKDACREEFARSIATYGYHSQAAHYISGCEHVLHESPAAVCIIAVESEPPHAVAVYALPSEAILAGQHLANNALALYREALDAGEFRGYPDTVETIELPRWALRFAA
jgi:exodeoxyribonuclease VIII